MSSSTKSPFCPTSETPSGRIQCNVWFPLLFQNSLCLNRIATGIVYALNTCTLFGIMAFTPVSIRYLHRFDSSFSIRYIPLTKFACTRSFCRTNFYGMFNSEENSCNMVATSQHTCCACTIRTHDLSPGSILYNDPCIIFFISNRLWRSYSGFQYAKVASCTEWMKKYFLHPIRMKISISFSFLIFI